MRKYLDSIKQKTIEYLEVLGFKKTLGILCICSYLGSGFSSFILSYIVKSFTVSVYFIVGGMFSTAFSWVIFYEQAYKILRIKERYKNGKKK